MAERSAIEWTDATFNPWCGCERVSPACAHCYADKLARRYGHELWNAGGRRRFFGDQHWAHPRKWNRDAEAHRKPLLVFCASMADVFEDHSQLDPWRDRLWRLIDGTPWLQWQLLTKRPENVERMVPWHDAWPSNVWIGTSVENARHTFRADILREFPARVRFISAEPLLGSLFLNRKPNHQPLDLAGIQLADRGRRERAAPSASRPRVGAGAARRVSRVRYRVLLQAAGRAHGESRWPEARWADLQRLPTTARSPRLDDGLINRSAT